MFLSCAIVCDRDCRIADDRRSLFPHVRRTGMRDEPKKRLRGRLLEPSLATFYIIVPILIATCVGVLN